MGAAKHSKPTAVSRCQLDELLVGGLEGIGRVIHVEAEASDQQYRTRYARVVHGVNGSPSVGINPEALELVPEGWPSDIMAQFTRRGCEVLGE